MTSIHGNYDGSFLFYPWMTSKKEYTSQNHPSSCTTFSLYVRLSMNSFYCYTPNPHCLTRPCFPKASAKVQPFTVTAKYYNHFFSSGNSCKFKKTSTNKQAYIPFDNQQINKYSWITFNLLKTYLLFILLIEKTYIALPELLL